MHPNSVNWVIHIITLMLMTTPSKKIQLSAGKMQCLKALSNESGILTALAMDQRGSLRKTIEGLLGRSMQDDELIAFKSAVSRALSPYASAILLDPQFGGAALKSRAANCGAILSYEQSGYDTVHKGRMLSLPPTLSVQRLVDQGAQGIKVMVYYDPDDSAEINDPKHALIERVGAECKAADVIFFLEPYTYTDDIPDEKSIAYAKVKPHKVMGTMRDFSEPRFGVDVLKVEVPVIMKYVDGSSAHTAGSPYAHTRSQAITAFQQAAAVTSLPFIYLSAGVSDSVFRETMQLAIESGVPFSGVLCGRATWQDGIPDFVKSGAEGFYRWLSDVGVQRIQALNAVLSKATPWQTRVG